VAAQYWSLRTVHYAPAELVEECAVAAREPSEVLDPPLSFVL
jgi:hypothetical protein